MVTVRTPNKVVLAAVALITLTPAAPASAGWHWQRRPPTPPAASLAAVHLASFVVDVPAARWNACADVPWIFDRAHAPAGGEAAVHAAVATVGVATGLRFVYLGPSTEVPDASYLTASFPALPLLIGWSTPTESLLLAGQAPTVIGVEQHISRASALIAGVIVLNADVEAPSTGANSWYTFALHELGHAVGLTHTADSSQIMSAAIPPLATDYGSGDLAGLASVGGWCGS